jgi:hypothetical protein
MSKWKCEKCGYDRNLRSNGWVGSCPFFDDPDINALREAIGVEDPPELIVGWNYECIKYLHRL